MWLASAAFLFTRRPALAAVCQLSGSRACPASRVHTAITTRPVGRGKKVGKYTRLMKTVGTQVVSVQDVGLYCDAPPTCPERSHEDRGQCDRCKEQRERERQSPAPVTRILGPFCSDASRPHGRSRAGGWGIKSTSSGTITSCVHLLLLI